MEVFPGALFFFLLVVSTVLNKFMASVPGGRSSGNNRSWGTPLRGSRIDLPWRRSDATRGPCPRGESCEHLQKRGHCFYFHERSHYDSEKPEQYRDTAITLNLQRLDCSIGLATLKPEPTPIRIENKRNLASFSKLTDRLIGVPGSPPRFEPLTNRIKIGLDMHNDDLLNFPMYKHPFEPLVRSISVMSPGFDLLATADLVTNASNLRKLFHMFQNRRHMVERYDLAWRYNTLFLSKWTGDPSLRSSLGRGAGFEKETCRYVEDDDDALKKSCSHHRVVWYRFGGLECVVQSEVDGYHCDCDPRQHEGGSGADLAQFANLVIHNDNELTCHHPLTPPLSPGPAMKSPPNLTGTAPPGPRTANNDPGGRAKNYLAGRQQAWNDALAKSKTMEVQQCGREIPSSCLVEVKTHRAGNTPMFPPEAQLYFTRRTKLFVAQHRYGVFYPPKDGHASEERVVKDMSEELVAWEEENQTTLAQVVALLKELRARVKELARKGPDGTARLDDISLVCKCDGNDKLEGVKVNLYKYMLADGKGVRLLPAGL
ncbi:hypothetical protein B0T22DRAFT_445800 [Podospora appendiculata]|uniref:C3H1-type domain-containing protein n=1 Tax=Podospora appendiculata TaxID=314037 RepID=A0AAE1C779_9PEZI|nr:hypothetical protein B0T22DRAFT_445800 [Podospora appendiculata]